MGRWRGIDRTGEIERVRECLFRTKTDRIDVLVVSRYPSQVYSYVVVSIFLLVSTSDITRVGVKPLLS